MKKAAIAILAVLLVTLAAWAAPASDVLVLQAEPCEQLKSALVKIGDKDILTFVCVNGKWRMYGTEDAAPAAVRPPAPVPKP